jgi:probable rRNA maturation factor
MPARIPQRPVKIYSGHPQLGFARPAIAAVVHALDGAAVARTERDRGSWCVSSGELSLAFLTDAALARLHADFLSDPSPTDVITFPGDSAHGLAGEICISVDTARSYAARHGREFAEELTLYLVHGYLHLAGYEDHKTPERRQIRAAERRAMAVLQTAKKIPEFKFGR